MDTRVIKSGLRLKKGKKPPVKDDIDAHMLRVEVVKNDNKERTEEAPLVDEDVKKVMSFEGLTSAERAHMIARLKRRQERIQKGLEMTHRERIAQLNNNLSKLSEHFDVPKVGPG